MVDLGPKPLLKEIGLYLEYDERYVNNMIYDLKIPPPKELKCEYCGRKKTDKETCEGCGAPT